jgi:hypothetical protein
METAAKRNPVIQVSLLSSFSPKSHCDFSHNIYLFRKIAINYNKKGDTKYRIPLAALLSDQDIFGKYNKELQSKNQKTVKGRLMQCHPMDLNHFFPKMTHAESFPTS